MKNLGNKRVLVLFESTQQIFWTIFICLIIHQLYLDFYIDISLNKALNTNFI